MLEAKYFSILFSSTLHQTVHSLSCIIVALVGLGALAKTISFRETHVGNTWFMIYSKGIYVKKGEILYTMITKINGIFWKSTKNNV